MSRALQIGLSAGVLILAGCAGTPVAGPGGDAEYKHPVSGDIQHCDNNTAGGAVMFGVIGGVVSGNRYANCKSDLEAKGYVRVQPASAKTDHPEEDQPDKGSTATGRPGGGSSR